MKRLLLLFVLFAPVVSLAQTSAVNGYCNLGATQAKTQGLGSTNYLQGVIPSCLVNVYLTGTTTPATIYADGIGTPLSNPFTASTLGAYKFNGTNGVGLDIVLNGGVSPNTYPSPVTLVDVVPGGGGSSGGGAVGPAGAIQRSDGSGNFAALGLVALIVEGESRPCGTNTIATISAPNDCGANIANAGLVGGQDLASRLSQTPAFINRTPYVANFAYGGSTCQTMRNNYITNNVASYAPGGANAPLAVKTFDFIQVGANNASSPNETTADAYMGCMTAHINEVVAAGITPVILTSYYMSDVGNTDKVLLHSYNQALNSLSGTYQGVSAPALQVIDVDDHFGPEDGGQMYDNLTTATTVRYTIASYSITSQVMTVNLDASSIGDTVFLGQSFRCGTIQIGGLQESFPLSYRYAHYIGSSTTGMTTFPLTLVDTTPDTVGTVTLPHLGYAYCKVQPAQAGRHWGPDGNNLEAQYIASVMGPDLNNTSTPGAQWDRTYYAPTSGFLDFFAGVCADGSTKSASPSLPNPQVTWCSGVPRGSLGAASIPINGATSASGYYAPTSNIYMGGLGEGLFGNPGKLILRAPWYTGPFHSVGNVRVGNNAGTGYTPACTFNIIQAAGGTGAVGEVNNVSATGQVIDILMIQGQGGSAYNSGSAGSNLATTNNTCTGTGLTVTIDLSSSAPLQVQSPGAGDSQGSWYANNPGVTPPTENTNGNLESYTGGKIPANSISISSGGTTYPMTTVFTLTSVATASGGNTVYTGTITSGGSNAYAGLTGITVAGFSTSANNGTFNVVSSTATTLTLNNAAGVSETTAATATSKLIFFVTETGASGGLGQATVSNASATAITVPDSPAGSNGTGYHGSLTPVATTGAISCTGLTINIGTVYTPSGALFPAGVTLASGGTNCAVGETITVVQSGASGGTLTVNSIANGVVTSLTNPVSGFKYTGTVVNQAAYATTIVGSGGSGFTVNLALTTAGSGKVVLGSGTIEDTGAAMNIHANGTVTFDQPIVVPSCTGCGTGSSPLTTKGDLYGFSTVNARIPVGADTFVLTADSTQALGVKWAAASGGGITALTGDGTATGPGSAALTLATVNSSPGSCGDSTHVCQVTTNGKGLTTGQTAVAITSSGTVNSGTTGQIGYYATSGTAVSGNSATLDSSGNATFGNKVSTTADGVHPSLLSWVGNTTLPALGANTFGIVGPPSTGFTAYALQAANSMGVGLLHVGSPTSGVSPLTSSLVDLTADVTGLLPNANLANPSTTVNGTPCTLGSTCTVTATATPGGSTGQVQYNNSGAFGGYPNDPTINTSLTSLKAQGAGNTLAYGSTWFGDSNTAGYALQGGFYNIAQQFFADTGVSTGINRAIQSNNAQDDAAQAAKTETTNHNQNPYRVVACCSNEGPTQGTNNTTNQNIGMNQSLWFIGSYLSTANDTVLAQSEQSLAFANATLTGGFATDATTFTANGSQGVLTATTGTATLKVPVGPTGILYCGVYEFTTSTGVYSMLDLTDVAAGVALTDQISSLSSFASQGLGRTPANLGSTWAGALRFTGLTPNTVRTIQQSVTSSGPTGFIGCWSPSKPGKHGQGAPTVQIGNTIPSQYNSYGSFISTVNGVIKTTVNQMVADGLNVVPWDFNSDLNTTSDFDSKSAIGTVLLTPGSGQTNGTYTEQATSDTCGGTTHIYLTYTIAGGVITAAPQPTVVPGTLNSYAQGCTAASHTIAHGGTPGTISITLSTNTGYTSAPPFHLSKLGALDGAASAEKAGQFAVVTTTGGDCSGTGSQTLNGQCHYLDIFGAATITMPTGASSPSVTQAGILPGMCWQIHQSSSAAAAIITFTGGSGGNASGSTIGPNSGGNVCMHTGNVYTIGYGAPNGVTQQASTFAYAGTASTPGLKVSGTPFAGTASNSYGSLSVDWNGSTHPSTLNTAGTGFTLFAPSGYTGDLMNLFTATTSEFSVGSGGAVTANGTMTSAGSVVAGGSFFFTINGKNKMSSPSDGISLFQNNAGTGLTRFQFGGTTTSFPGLCFAGTAITSCLADGSVGSTFSAPNLTLSSQTGTATYTAGSGVTSVACASGFSCNNTRGTLTIVGGTATTGTIATVNFSTTLSAAPFCVATMNGGSTVFSIGNSAPTTAAFNITAGISVIGATFNVNYVCQP